MNALHVSAAASGTFTIGGDLTVNRLGFGAMRITGKGIWGEPKDLDSARDVLRHAVELGVNFIDTADSYGPEVSENLIAEALHPYPEDLIIATKGGLTRQGPDQWLPVGRPEYLRQCVEMSLRRLKLERIDLYQLHRIDPKVPAEERVQHHRPQERENAAVLREAQPRFHPMVAHRRRRSHKAGRTAGPDRKTSRCDRGTIGHRMAAAPLPGHPADPRHLLLKTC